jgi:hypothetical protein
MPEPATTVTVGKLTEPGELHRHYPNENRPQPAVLSLDILGGWLTCRYNPEIGNALPETVVHRLAYWWDIPILTAEAANRLLDDARPLAQRILDGTRIAWTGSHHAGILDRDAEAAREEMAALCAPHVFAPSELVVEYDDPADFYAEETRTEIAARLGITATTTDARIAELAAQEEQDVPSGSEYGLVIVAGIEGYLRELRDNLAEEWAEWPVPARADDGRDYARGGED